MTNDLGSDVFDVLVIGGGVAGLSGALTLSRARRSVLVLDSGEPRNAPAAAAHGLLSRDGVAPLELLRAGRVEVQMYGGVVVSEWAVNATRADGLFGVETESGKVFRARRLLVTTGLADELPELPGLSERWGRDVLHCPYCHGWEVQDTSVGVLGTGVASMHQALLFRQWSSRVTLFLHTGPEPEEEQWERLAARGIEVVHGEVAGVEVTDGKLSGVRLDSGLLIPMQALVVAPRFAARSALLAGLGISPVPHPMGLGTYVPADAMGATEVAGVWVAGNVADLMAGLAQAQSQGVTAAAAINADLVNADADEAVARLRAAPPGGPFSAASDAMVTERVLGVRRRGLDSLLPDAE
ncbi:NAD(P)/FAD-dependent oxidoreductase [Streptomyces flavofungini]|uniref:NAD(P)/FAD-dependent oxidoreductase n=1 Tax=Streptomyces flavofungini TaxID=68200 RepID=UPI0034E04AC4